MLPAELAFGELIGALGEGVEAAPKQLEVFAAEAPPAGYTLDRELEGIRREADARGWERFHLVGFSAGGAAALAFAASDPGRLSSLALLEPAWPGARGRSPAELAVDRRFEALEGLRPAEFLPAFQRILLRPGVDPPPPPPGPPPPWMARRPAGIAALTSSFTTYDLDSAALARFERPVYYALGGLSNPDLWEEIATRLAATFPDFTVERFEERHHFDPPHLAEPERLARSLQALWARGVRE
jgi:pimeloyl-ACP methyl ester carboxylesterase